MIGEHSTGTRPGFRHRGRGALGLFVACTVSLFLAGPLGAAQDDGGHELFQLVVGLLREKDKDLQALGWEQVRTELKGEAFTLRFAELLPQLDEEAQMGLANALAGRGDPAARPAIIRLLESSAAGPLRAAAIQALGGLGSAEDVPRLVGLLRSDSPVEQVAAEASLGHLPGATVPPAIIAEMRKAATTVHVALIRVLVARRALGGLPALLEDAIGDNPQVRAAAMAGLGELGGPEHLAGIIAGVLSAEPGPERAAAEKSIVFVCERISDREQRADALLRVMRSLPPDQKLTLLPTLGRIGGPAAREEIEAVIADPDPQLRAVGLRALCNWPDATLAPRFIELVNAPASPEQRTMALRALIRVAPLADERSDAERLDLMRQAMNLCGSDDERRLVLRRARAIRTPDTLRFVLTYVDHPTCGPQSCETIVELAHHRELRESHKREFDQALDRVLAVSQDAVVIDRAQRYKKGQTWTRPAGSDKTAK